MRTLPPRGYLRTLLRLRRTPAPRLEPVDRNLARRRCERELEPIALREARHSFASLLLAAGVNVKAISNYLGHAGVALTLDRYGHLLSGHEAEAVTKIDSYLVGSAARTIGCVGDAQRELYEIACQLEAWALRWTMPRDERSEFDEVSDQVGLLRSDAPWAAIPHAEAVMEGIVPEVRKIAAMLDEVPAQ